MKLREYIEQEVHYAPSKGTYEDMEFEESDEDVNAVCIN
jgi:hypothetical protein